MPSSRTDRDDIAARLRQLTRGYDDALEAVLQGDLDRVAKLLGDNGALLAAPSSPAGGAPAASAELHELQELQELHAAATAAHGRLAATLRSVQDAVAAELAQVRRGRRALAGYSDPTRGLGDRHQSRA